MSGGPAWSHRLRQHGRGHFEQRFLLRTEHAGPSDYHQYESNRLGGLDSPFKEISEPERKATPGVPGKAATLGVMARMVSCRCCGCASRKSNPNILVMQ